MKIKFIVDSTQFFHANSYTVGQNNPRFNEAVAHNIENVLSKIKLQFPTGTEFSEVLAFDDRPYFRSDIYPAYKGHRENDSNWNKTYNYLSKSLKLKCLKWEKAEADDLIFMYADFFHKVDGNAVIIVSSDNDHCQTVQRTGCLQICPWHGLKDYSEIDWRSKVIRGCVNDNVPSIVPKKWVVEKGVPKEKIQRAGEITLKKLFDSGMTIRQIGEHFGATEADLQRNYQLIVYNHDIYRSMLPNYLDLVNLMERL